MAVIAITGRKGGIGKSTLTANVAAEFAAQGRTVAVLDADPQKSLVAWSQLGEGILSRCVEPIETEHPERFRAAVRAKAQAADVVLIDTPPGFADPALLAALVADVVLLPAGPSPLDLLAVREALALAHDVRKQRNDGKPIIRFVPSKGLPTTTLGRDLRASLEELGEKVLPAINQRIAVAESALSGLTVGEYAPGSLAHMEFQTLTKAIGELLR